MVIRTERVALVWSLGTDIDGGVDGGADGIEWCIIIKRSLLSRELDLDWDCVVLENACRFDIVLFF